MSAAVMSLDAHHRARTNGSMAVSAGFHALLFLWIAFWPREQFENAPLTEITYLDSEPSPSAPVIEPAPASVERVARTEIPPPPKGVTLERGSAPDLSLNERIDARLAELQRGPSVAVGVPNGGLPEVVASPSAARTAALVAGPGGVGTAPIALHRGGSGPPLTLSRGGAGGSAAAAVVATGLPAERSKPAAATGGESTARRTLAGASLIGPVADRAILNQVTPIYPEWAKHEAVEGSVTLYFVVRADGAVAENVLVQKTAGFEDFDESARTALRAWRFEALRGGRTGEQWGTITFHFRLRGSG